MRFNQLSVSLYTILFLIIILPAELTPQSINQKGPFLATGIRIGDVSQTEAVIWTRLTLNKNRVNDAPQPIALYTDTDTGKKHVRKTRRDKNGMMISIMEDVGRHNAMDKVTGQLVIEGKTPSVCVLSGRISYELVQKALMTGFKVVSAVGSATTLAIQVAKENDLTLISFSRGDRMTILSAPRRVV